MVQGDLNDVPSLVRAFTGATAIFSNTDFFTHLFHGLDPANLPAGRTPAQYAYDREVAQGVNTAEAASHPSVVSTLRLFVFSSLSDATKHSGGKYTTVYHFDSKAETIRQIRARFPAVAERMSTVQLGHYVTNWKAFAKMAPERQADGSFVMSRTTSPLFRMPHVVAHRDTGPFVQVLVDMPPGKNVLAVSEYMTFPEYAETWGRVLGVRVVYQQVTSEAFYKEVPGPLAEELDVGFEYIEEFGFTGGDASVLEAGQLGVEVPVTSMEEYIRSEDWSSIWKS